MKFKSLILASLVMLFVGCNSAKKKDTQDKKEITIAYVDGWAEGVAMTYVTKNIFEAQGYTVTLKKAAVDLVFASLANGDVDAFMDTWLPVTHKEKIARFDGKIESLGTALSNARIGLVVPAYVSINSIEELNSVADKFDNRIIGIEKGAGITAKTDLAVEEYGLELEQMNSSSIAMLTELTKAIGEDRWVVVAGWAPHWKFGRYDLKFLEDPKGIYGATEHIEIYARKGFKEEDTFAANYFTNFHMTDTEIGVLLAQMKDGSEDKDAAAKAWIAANPELVKNWLKTAE